MVRGLASGDIIVCSTIFSVAIFESLHEILLAASDMCWQAIRRRVSSLSSVVRAMTNATGVSVEVQNGSIEALLA